MISRAHCCWCILCRVYRFDSAVSLEFVSLYIKYISFIDDVLDVKKDLQSQRPCRIVRG